MKGDILCDSKSMTFWKRQKYRDSRKVSGCQGLGGRERGIGGAQRVFGQ